MFGRHWSSTLPLPSWIFRFIQEVFQFILWRIKLQIGMSTVQPENIHNESWFNESDEDLWTALLRCVWPNIPIRMNSPSVSLEEGKHVNSLGKYAMDFIFIPNLYTIQAIRFGICHYQCERRMRYRRPIVLTLQSGHTFLWNANDWTIKTTTEN